MRAGQMKWLLTIMVPVNTVGPIGNVMVNYTAGDTIPTVKRQLTANERMDSGEITSQADVEFVIRYRTDITTRNQVVCDGYTYTLYQVFENPFRSELHLRGKAQT